jgi:hypothetical protein
VLGIVVATEVFSQTAAKGELSARLEATQAS